ncbi:MAG: hypothetical protein Q4Q17_03030 [Tissierellia bacterium]|nr:hypothetical protein [Tissierellia bacterium]
MRDLKIIFKKALLDTIAALRGDGKYFIPFFIGCLFLLRGIEEILHYMSHGPIGFISGILNGLATVAVYAVLAKVLNSITLTNRFSLRGLFYNYGTYFFNVLNVAFYIYVARFLLFYSQPLFMAGELNFYSGPMIFFIVMQIVLNPLPETVYVEGVTGGTAFRRCLLFMKDNFLPWLLLNLFYIFIFFAKDILFRGEMEVVSIQTLLMLIVIPLLFIMRGKAYLFLYQTTKRKRAFMSEYDDFF